MIKQSDKILAEELVKKGLITQQVADQCLTDIQNSNESLQTYLANRKYVSEKQILEALSAILRLANLDLKNIQIDKAVIQRVPVRFAWYYKFMPVKVENKTLILASASPLDVKVLDEIRTHLGLEPQVVLAKESDILEAQNKYYGLAADMIERLVKETPKAPTAELPPAQWIENLEKGSDEASVIKLVNQILLEAYKQRATDIHIEPYRNKVRIRYRIDGGLVDANIPPSVKQFLPSIISRIKILANLSIVEKRVPQDGSAVVKTKEKDLDLRISTLPTQHGESMVIRILPTDVILLSLERLGLGNNNLKLFREIVNIPHGIILVTGPTGSGKTTSLYACLNEINSPDVKIITLEDPVEYELEGLTQIQLNPKVNVDFAAGLRSVLRHDPDIIMVGEIRDLETAEIAIRTALTGHLVFSTLHTNDAASGVTRLIEMGLEPFLVGSSVEAFIAQRLLRIICSHCKEEVKAPLLEIREEIARSLRIKEMDKIKIFSGRGCDNCHGTGFYGRTAIYEVLIVNEDIRAAILEKQRAEYIKKIAIKNGMTTLRQDGWSKVLEGITTPMEVINSTVKDEFLDDVETILPPAEINSRALSESVRSRQVSPETLAAKNEFDSRTYPRAKAKISIHFVVFQQDKTNPTKLITDGIEHVSVTNDISAGGVRFVSGYALPVGTILDLKIHLGKTERSVDCLAKVCRVEDEHPSTMHSLSAFYLDITSADRVKINHFVKSLVEQTAA